MGVSVCVCESMQTYMGCCDHKIIYAEYVHVCLCVFGGGSSGLYVTFSDVSYSSLCLKKIQWTPSGPCRTDVLGCHCVSFKVCVPVSPDRKLKKIAFNGFEYYLEMIMSGSLFNSIFNLVQ